MGKDLGSLNDNENTVSGKETNLLDLTWCYLMNASDIGFFKFLVFVHGQKL